MAKKAAYKLGTVNTPSMYKGATYFAINGIGHNNVTKVPFGVRKHRWTGDKYDKARQAVGNVFSTMQKAQAKRDVLASIVKLA